jgi:hypothetical protein
VNVDVDTLLLAYFLDEQQEDGEQIRFAVSAGPGAGWVPLSSA